MQLKQLHGRCMLQLEDLVGLIRRALSDLERKVRVRACVFVSMEGAPCAEECMPVLPECVVQWTGESRLGGGIACCFEAESVILSKTCE